jgi:hypothetical protein
MLVGQSLIAVLHCDLDPDHVVPLHVTEEPQDGLTAHHSLLNEWWAGIEAVSDRNAEHGAVRMIAHRVLPDAQETAATRLPACGPFMTAAVRIAPWKVRHTVPRLRMTITLAASPSGVGKSRTPR